MSSAGTPHTSAARSGDQSAATVSASSAPRVWRSRKRAVEQPVALEHVQHRVQQRQVGAGPHRQVQVGVLGGRRAARVGDDQERALGCGSGSRRSGGRTAALEPTRKMHFGLVDVGVGRRRPVRAERARVARDRAGHAQARVGVDVVGAEEALGQLVDRVVVLGQQLAGDVERDLVGLDALQACATIGRSPRASCRSASARPALARHIGVVARSGAWTASGRRVGLRQVAPRLTGCSVSPRTATRRPSRDLGDQPAADAAVRAGRLVVRQAAPRSRPSRYADLVDGDRLRPVERRAGRPGRSGGRAAGR